MSRFQTQVQTGAPLSAALAELLAPAEIKALRHRAEALVAEGHYPLW